MQLSLDILPRVKKWITEANEPRNATMMRIKTLKCSWNLPKPLNTLTEREINSFEWSLYNSFKANGWVE